MLNIKLIIYLAFSLFFSCNLKSNNKSNLDSTKVDNIKFLEIKIENVFLGEKIRTVKEKFKNQILKQTQRRDEFESEEIDILTVLGGDLYFKAHKLDGFKINNQNINLSIGEISDLKVNDNISKLASLFPNSYDKYLSEKRNLFMLQIENSDSYIVFEIQDNKIVSIYSWDDK